MSLQPENLPSEHPAALYKQQWVKALLQGTLRFEARTPQATHQPCPGCRVPIYVGRALPQKEV